MYLVIKRNTRVYYQKSKKHFKTIYRVNDLNPSLEVPGDPLIILLRKCYLKICTLAIFQSLSTTPKQSKIGIEKVKAAYTHKYTNVQT